MTRQRRRPETIVERLLRLGILSEVDEATGRRITWSEDFRAVLDGDPDLERRTRLEAAVSSDDPDTVQSWLAQEASAVRAERDAGRERSWTGVPRPAAADLLAHTLMGQAEPFGMRQMAVLDFLHAVGVLDSVEIDEESGAIRMSLAPAYLRLIEAGREPDRELGFDEAWDAGGPAAVRAWLEVEAQKLPRGPR